MAMIEKTIHKGRNVKRIREVPCANLYKLKSITKLLDLTACPKRKTIP